MADNKIYSASTTAPVNIAVVKCVLSLHPQTQHHPTPAKYSSRLSLPPRTLELNDPLSN